MCNKNNPPQSLTQRDGKKSLKIN